MTTTLAVLLSILVLCGCGLGPAPGCLAQPMSSFDYDPAANVFYTNTAFVVVNHITTNASVVVRTLHTLLLGNKDAPEDSMVGGNFTLEAGASLFMDTVCLHLGGQFFQVESGLLADDQCTLIHLSRNATISGDISNGSLCLNASNVSTCVVVETNNATVALYQGFVPMMTNVSCITSFFAQVNVTSGTSGAGTGSTPFVWPDASSCKTSSMIAAAVIMACPDDPPTATTESNYPVGVGLVPGTNYPIITISGIDNNNNNNSGGSNSSELAENPPLISAYWTIILIVAGCIFVVVLLVVILVVIVMKNPALRLRFMPFRDRTRFVSTTNPPQTHDTSMSISYPPPSLPSQPMWRRDQYTATTTNG